MGKMKGGCNALKTKTPSSRKILRFEPLEERQLLAVDFGLGGFGNSSIMGNVSTGESESMRVIFPQPRWYYETAQTPWIAHSRGINRNEPALVPTGIFATETSTETVENARTLVRERLLEKYLLDRLTKSEFAGIGFGEFGEGAQNSSASVSGDPPLDLYCLKTNIGYLGASVGKPYTRVVVPALQETTIEIVNGVSKLVRTAYVETEFIDPPHAEVTILGEGSEYWTQTFVGTFDLG